MSQYGLHPVITKDEAKALLPPNACKLCVYWTRVYGRPGYNWPCKRCGSGKGVSLEPRIAWRQPVVPKEPA